MNEKAVSGLLKNSPETAFFKNSFLKYTTFMINDVPDLPNYVSTKEAAKMLGVSERRIRLYIEMKRLPAVRAADVLMIPLEDVTNFTRKIVGRPRKNALAWRISSIDNAQFMTFISVQMRPRQEEKLLQLLEEIKRDRQHMFPGTVARYIVRSEIIPAQVEIVLIWRGIVMPNQVERERELKALQQVLADVLDWNTAQYDQGQILMHT